MDKKNILHKLKQAHDEYFKLLLDTYPTKHPITEDSSFGNPRSCELAVEAQSCLVALGVGAQNRMIAIGFDILYPFNNIVDQYSWRKNVIAKDVSFTNFASIAIRLDAEIQIIENILEMDAGDQYDIFPTGMFIESKSRYLEAKYAAETTNSDLLSGSGTQDHATNNVDSEAVGSLIEHERKTNIMSNYANLANVAKIIFG